MLFSSQYRPRYRVFLWPVTSVSAYRISAFRSTRRESMQLSKRWCNNGTGHATPPRIQSGSHYNDTVNDNQEKVKCKAGQKKNNYKEDNYDNVTRNIIISRYPILSQF